MEKISTLPGRLRTALLLAALALCAVARGGEPDAARTVGRLTLFGAGRVNVLDTYLSPHEYAGPSVSVMHLTERLARWGRGRVTVSGLYRLEGSYVRRTTGGGYDAWDGDLDAAVAWRRHWQPSAALRLALGGFAELTTGFTYLSRGGNNPAQGRLSLAGGVSAVAAAALPLRRLPLSARLQLDVPLAGACFTPDYGQSYYEIFGLGHRTRNVRFTWPVTAPSARVLATLQLPVGRSRLAVGYSGEARQTHLNHLRRHAWSHRFMLGYVRYLRSARQRAAGTL